MTPQADVNFLPEDYVEKRASQRSAIIVVGLFVLELAAIVGGYWYLRQRPINELHAENARLDQLQELKSKELADFKEMTAQKEAMQTKVDLMAQLMERVKRSELLNKLHAALGKDTKLSSLDLKTKEISVARPAAKLDDARNQIAAANEPIRLPPTETTIEVMGLAPSHEHVAAFLANLGKIDLIEGAQPLFSEEYKIDTQTYRRFKVSMTINPKADTRFIDKHASAGSIEKSGG